MRSITFSFRPDLPPGVQEQTLARINAQDGIHKAGALHPGATHPLLSRLGYAYVGLGTSQDSIAEGQKVFESGKRIEWRGR